MGRGRLLTVFVMFDRAHRMMVHCVYIVLYILGRLEMLIVNQGRCESLDGKVLTYQAV